MSKLTWKYKEFEDYLMEICMYELNCLDDDMPDAFSDWLCDLDPQSFIEYADKYAAIKVKEEPRKQELLPSIDYANENQVIGSILGTLNSFNNKVINPMKALRQIELAAKEHARLRKEKLDEITT